jgi:hypothetical protein
MKDLLVGMNSSNEDKCISLPRTGSGNSEEGNMIKHSSPLPRKKKSGESTATVPGVNEPNQNWQSAVSVDSLKGVMGSFLSVTPAVQSTSFPSNPSNSQSNSAGFTQILEVEIQKLKKQNINLQEANNKYQQTIGELEKSLEQAENSTKEAEKWADEEFKILSERVDEAIRERNDVYEKLESAKAENERLQKQITRSALKYTNYEDRLSHLNHRIDILEKELKETKASAIPPEEFKSLQDRVQELMGSFVSNFNLISTLGESKHWQQKAMSLSKEMQRSMSVQMELTRVQQELMTMKARMEVY